MDWQQSRGRLLVLGTPAGNYEIHDWVYSVVYLEKIDTFRGKQEFSIKYQAKPGRITYIGSIHIDIVDKAYKIAIHDERERDLKLLQSKYSNLLTNNTPVNFELSEIKFTTK